ncbi:MAG: ArgE/DapE family deacylase [Acidobacteriota bacterium]
MDRSFVQQTLADLVSIPSVNPTLSPEGHGEAEIGAYVLDLLVRLDLSVVKHEPEPGRVSVVGTLPGAGGGRSLMLNAHYDTVAVDGMAAPFDPQVRENRLYGRGAYDMKASLAACIGAAKALRDAKIRLAGDLLIAAVADEEYASIGTAEVVRHHPVDGAIVTEPTDLAICLAHKGFTWIEVETRGRAAHGSQHEIGIDANLRMGRFLSELAGLEQQLRTTRGKHPLVGSPSLHAAVLHGGTGLSTYAESSVVQIERRMIPGETPDQVETEIRTILDRIAMEDHGFEASMRTLLVREPFEVGPDSDIVTISERSVTSVLGKPPALVGENPWMDSALLAAAGADTVVLGPSGAGAHAVEEWVDLESVFELTAILAEIARDYCRTPGD